MTKKEEILSILEVMKGRLNNLSFSDKSQIENLHPIVLRRPFTKTGCGDCYRDAVIQMIIYLQKNEIMKKKSSYLLKAGVILMISGDVNIYNNSNLTDEAAEKYLKANPKAIGQFETYPEDWESRVKEEPPVELTESEKEFISILAGKLKEGVTKTALKEEYKEYEIEGKKVTQRAMTDYLKKADELNGIIDPEKDKE